MSEYEVMGAIRGAPVELIKCETSDLMVPANCEMVIEGFIDSDETLIWRDRSVNTPAIFGVIKDPNTLPK